jgi:hypothetical protein
MQNESIVLTETKKEILAKRARRAVTPDKVYSLDTLSSNAEILAECGGHAALVFRAIVGSYWFSSTEKRQLGFKLHPAFCAAINLPDRQRQRATQRLEKAGYIERLIPPGNKMLIRLTKKGEQALTPSRA